MSFEGACLCCGAKVNDLRNSGKPEQSLAISEFHQAAGGEINETSSFSSCHLSLREGRFRSALLEGLEAALRSPWSLLFSISLCLSPGQSCSSPQNIFLASSGLATTVLHPSCVCGLRAGCRTAGRGLTVHEEFMEQCSAENLVELLTI
ncbi:uncharacterized protein ACIB01_012789 isoform 2-T2 [Guaruba guarouba]